MPKLEDLKAELLPLIKKHAHIKLPEPIKLSSGKMSDQYFDGRKITLHPQGITLFARAILEMIKPADFDAVGGPSLGADPIATAVSIFAFLDRKIKLPAFLIRSVQKPYGLQKQVEGAELKPGMTVLIVEDVMTTGKSIRSAIEVVEQTGAKVGQIICLIDRNEGGREALASYQLSPLFTKDEIGA
ncbi:MAG: orotate phosphoribosyltransferase [Omnitrophica bacterium RIFCSPLOWO2_12_FULL_50_11]|nr:MAG: orotate phosphoribosyltransferase [Omnitrophica bacterium RIFCSPLOWO2_12_FULL_50_11]